MEFNATFIVSIISFLVFMKIMNAIFYNPITDVIKAREEITNSNYEASKIAKEEIEQLLLEKENKLSDASKQSRQILIDKTNEANSAYQEKITEAKTKSNERLNELKNELQSSEKEAQTALCTHVEELAQTIVNKILQGGLNG